MKWRGISFYLNLLVFGQDNARNLYELCYGKQKEWKTKKEMVGEQK